MTESTELAVLNIPLLPVAVYETEGGVESILKKLEDDAEARVFDISTEDGRAEIKSYAYKLARSKTALDDMGAELKAEAKAKCDAIDADRRKLKAGIEALQEKVRKPLTDWEDREKKRKSDHEERIARLIALADVSWGDLMPTEIQSRIDALDEFKGMEWQEFQARGEVAYNNAVAVLMDAKEKRANYDAEQAELARLKKEEEDRRVANEKRITAHQDEINIIRSLGEVSWADHTTDSLQEMSDAVDELFKARAWEEFQQQAQRNADEAKDKITAAVTARKKYDEEQAELEKRRAQDEENERIRKENEENQKALDKAENDRKAEHEYWIDFISGQAEIPEGYTSAEIQRRIDMLNDNAKADRDWQEFKDRADDAFGTAINSLTALLANAQVQEKSAADAAEAKRLKDIADAAQKKIDDDAAAEKKRSEDLEHKRKINNASADAIVALSARVEGIPGVTIDQARAVVAAIAKGEIPHTKIIY